ncbi:MAG: NAD-dependent epimerase/dehydratase family protein [Candidatus Xenobia bacterium]
MGGRADAMKVLVTGGAGFLGRGIAEHLLSRGEQVAVLVRRPVDLKGAEIVRADITDREATIQACQGRDLVFHVAAKAGIWGDPQEYQRCNVEGTRNVLEGCRQGGVQRLVYTSSPSVTFDGTDAVNADESLPYANRFECTYAETKAQAERMVLAETAFLTTALRPHLIWGPGDPHLIPRLVAAAKAGRLMQVGDGTNQVDITYIENAVMAHVQAGDRLTVGGRAYFISHGNPVTLWPWINDLLRRLGIPPVTRSIPLGVARRLGSALETTWRLLRLKGEPRMTRFLASQLATTHTYNIAAARRDLGYEPRVSNEEGMEHLLSWLRTRG